MAKLVAVLLSLLSVLFGIHGEDEIQCNLLPPGSGRSDANQVPEFGINTNATEIIRGSVYPVKVSIMNLAQNPNDYIRFRVFTLQAHDMDDKAHGRWESTSEMHLTRKCDYGDADTLYNHPHMMPTVTVSALWYPPSEDIIQDEVDFNAAVVLGDGRFWTDIRSIMLKVKDVHTDSSEFAETGPETDETEAQPYEPESTETGEDPNESEEMDEDQRRQEEHRDNDDHGLAEEEELARQAEERMEADIRAEDDASEADWVRELEEEREREEEQQHQEMVEYERVMAEEETKRQEMIQWEIRDKEEHDRMLADKTTRRPDVIDTKPDLEDGGKPPKAGDDRNNINPGLVVGDSAAALSFSLLLALLPALLLLL